MIKKLLFNIYVLLIGALGAINCYLLFLLGLYDEQIEINLLSTIITMIMFIVTIGSIYAIIVIALKHLDKYSLLIQTLSFILIGTLLFTFIIPIILGIGVFNSLTFITTIEGLLITVAVLFCNLICSYGIWVAQTKGNKKTFNIIAIFILITSIIVF